MSWQMIVVSATKEGEVDRDGGISDSSSGLQCEFQDQLFSDSKSQSKRNKSGFTCRMIDESVVECLVLRRQDAWCLPCRLKAQY